MKFIVCAIAVFAALQYVGCYVPSDDSRELITKLTIQQLKESMALRPEMEQVRSKLNEVCPGYGNRLENVTAEIAVCAELVDDSEETLCSIIKNHFKKCIKPATDMFKECLPTEAKQIPQMLVDMVMTLTNHLCKADGEHIFELGNTCVRKMNAKTQMCARRIFSKIQQYRRKESIPSAADICELLSSLRPCLQSHLNSACGHHITRESFLDLYDDALKVCSNYRKNEIESN